MYLVSMAAAFLASTAVRNASAASRRQGLDLSGTSFEAGQPEPPRHGRRRQRDGFPLCLRSGVAYPQQVDRQRAAGVGAGVPGQLDDAVVVVERLVDQGRRRERSTLTRCCSAASSAASARMRRPAASRSGSSIDRLGDRSGAVESPCGIDAADDACEQRSRRRIGRRAVDVGLEHGDPRVRRVNPTSGCAPSVAVRLSR